MDFRSSQENFLTQLKDLNLWFQEAILSIQYESKNKQYSMDGLKSMCHGLYPDAIIEVGKYCTPLQKPFVAFLVTALENIHQCLILCKSTENMHSLLISIQDMRVIYSCLELLWHWGMEPFIIRLAEYSLPDDKNDCSKALLVDEDLLQFSRNDDLNVKIDDNILADLLRLSSLFFDILLEDIFVHQMLERNISRLLLCLFTLEKNKTVEGTVDLMLNHLVSSEYKDIVVMKLRHFIRAPDWLRASASKMLGNIILSDRGVETVIQAYISGIQ